MTTKPTLPVLRLSALLILLGTGALVGCNKSSEPAPQPTKPVVEKKLTPGEKLPALPPTTDPNVMVERMLANYKAVKSLQCKSEADIVQSASFATEKKAIHQYATTKYRTTPASIVYITRDPDTGTVTFVADGKTLVLHKGTDNSFQRWIKTGALPDLAKAMEKHLFFLMSPVNFTHNLKTLDGISDLKFRGREKVKGRECLVVDASFTKEFVDGMTSLAAINRIPNTKVRLPAGSCTTTLWIDAETYLLQKSDNKFVFEGTVNVNNVPQKLSMSMRVTEVAIETVVNPTFAEEEFRFIPPTGSKEVFTENMGK